jgi:TRAP-type C4-dicarboxylate transport system permease small subunit
LEKLTRAAIAVSRAGTWFGGALLFAASALVGVEVLLRRFLNVSIPGTDELSGYAMAVGVAWAFGFTLLRRAHVRVDSLYVLLPKPVRAVLDIVGLAALTVFFSLVTWYAWTAVWWRSFDVGTRSMSRLETPLWVPQALWGIGLVLFLLCALLLLVRSVVALVRGDPNRVQQLIGSRSALEETVDEVADASARLAGEPR